MIVNDWQFLNLWNQNLTLGLSGNIWILDMVNKKRFNYNVEV